MGGLDGFPGWGGLIATEQVAEVLNKRKAAEQAAEGCRAGTGECRGPGAVTSSGGMELSQARGTSLGGMELSQARGDGAVTSSGAGPSCLAGRLADVERMCSFFLAGMCIELDGRILSRDVRVLEGRQTLQEYGLGLEGVWTELDGIQFFEASPRVRGS